MLELIIDKMVERFYRDLQPSAYQQDETLQSRLQEQNQKFQDLIDNRVHVTISQALLDVVDQLQKAVYR